MPRTWLLLQEEECCVHGIAVGWGKQSSTSLVSSRSFLPPDASSLTQLMDQGFVSTCTKLYLKQTFNVMFSAVENPEPGLAHCDFWWFIPSCMPSLIFRLNGQRSRNPLQIQPGGRYGQKSVMISLNLCHLGVGMVKASLERLTISNLERVLKMFEDSIFAQLNLHANCVSDQKRYL